MSMHLFHRSGFGIMALALVVSASPAMAQNARASANARAAVEQRDLARQEAYASFKTGNPVAGLARLSGLVRRGPRERDPDLQVAGDLAAICTRLSNEGDAARTNEVAALALGKIHGAKSRVPAKDAAAGLTLAGQLYDFVLRDPAQAKAAYEAALVYDPTAKLAAERVAYFRAAEARAAEKTAANDLLRQRAREAKR